MYTIYYLNKRLKKEMLMNHKIMKNVIITAVVISSSTLYSKSLMPRIDQLRSKIDSISKDGQTVNLQALLANARIEQDKNGGIRKIISFDQNQSNDFSSLEKEVSSLYWSRQTDFIALKNASKADRINFLHNKLIQKYPNNNHTLITFASDLATEETKITDLTTRILKAIGDEKDTTTKKSLNQLLQTVNQLKQQLSTLFNIVNETLMS